MQHVELIGHRTLLIDWNDLEPAHALSLTDHCRKTVPLLRIQGVNNIDFKTLKFGILLLLFRLVIFSLLVLFPF